MQRKTHDIGCGRSILCGNADHYHVIMVVIALLHVHEILHLVLGWLSVPSKFHIELIDTVLNPLLGIRYNSSSTNTSASKRHFDYTGTFNVRSHPLQQHIVRATEPLRTTGDFCHCRCRMSLSWDSVTSVELCATRAALDCDNHMRWPSLLLEEALPPPTGGERQHQPLLVRQVTKCWVGGGRQLVQDIACSTGM